MQFWPMILSTVLSSGDPSSLLVGAPAATGDLGEAIAVTIDDAVIADNPAEMAYREWALVDTYGDPLDHIETTDLLQALVQLYGPTLPVGARVGTALTVNGVAGTGSGAYVGLRRDTAGIVAEHSYRSSTTWTSWSSGQANSLTRTAIMQLMQGNSASGGRIGVSTRDASGRISRIPSASTNPSSANISGRHTRIAMMWGTTTSGLIAGDALIEAALKLSATPSGYALGVERDAPATPSPIDVSAATKVNVGMIGHSIMVGTVIDTVHGGNPVPAGFDLLDNGTAYTDWQSGTGGRHCSILPYVVDELVSLSATGGHLVRRATTGQDLGQSSNADVALNAMIQDFETLGVTPDIVIVWFGANDGQTAEEVDAYAVRLAEWQVILREVYPDAIVALMGEWSAYAPGWPYVADGSIDVVKADVAGDLPSSWIHIPADPVTWTLADGIHLTRAGYEAAASDLVTDLATAF
jgi:lysophospholipase L1-like esterase